MSEAVPAKNGELSIERIAAALASKSEVMAQISQRYARAYYAARGGNWGLAGYFLRQIRARLRNLAVVRPKYARQLEAFDNEALSPLFVAVEHRDFAEFERRFAFGVKRANHYHAETGHPYIRWQLPSTPPDDLDLADQDGGHERRDWPVEASCPGRHGGKKLGEHREIGANDVTDETELRAELQRLTDRLDVIEIFARFATAADARDRTALKQVLTPDVVLEHTQTVARDPGAQWVGVDAVVERIIPAAPRDIVSQRLITDHRIELSGDRASVVAAILGIRAEHTDDGRQTVQFQHGWYLVELVRTTEGWQIARLRPSVWTSLGLPVEKPLDPALQELRRREAREHLEPEASLAGRPA